MKGIPSSSREMPIPENVGLKNRWAGMKTANGNTGVEGGMKGRRGRAGGGRRAHHAYNKRKSGA